MEKKPTRREMFYKLLTLREIQESPEYTAFIEKEIEKIKRDAKARIKGRKTRADDLRLILKNALLANLYQMKKPSTVTEIMAFNDKLSNYTCQRLTVALTQLVQEGYCIRTVEHKIGHYSLSEQGLTLFKKEG